MHVLVVLCHPRASSFCAELAGRVRAGAAAAGATVELADLYREGFDPVFRDGDYVQFEGGAMPPEILAEQARVERSDAIALVSPVWWLGLPAMLKGWFDRVWSNGWAYEWSNNPEGSLLRPRPFLFVLSAAGSPGTYARYGYAPALDALLRTGLLGWCGVSASTVAILHDTGFDAAASDGHLAYGETLGAALVGGVAAAPAPGVTLLV